MPRVDITDAQVADIAAWLHSLPVTSRADPNAENINIVTGDAPAGKAYFQKTSAKCHSTTGDLQELASKLPTARYGNGGGSCLAMPGEAVLQPFPRGCMFLL
jgi:hypothetical protein